MSDGEISLYFGLREGEKADLEVVAAAAIHWVETMRAAARELIPGAEIRVDLINASEGSIRLNGVLDWVENQLIRIEEGTKGHPRLWKLALGLVIFVPTVGVPTYDFYFGDEPTLSLNAKDRELLEEYLDKANKNPEVKTKRLQFFQTLERDSSISSAGIAESHASKPVVSVPSDQFAERSGLWIALAEDEPQERTTYPVFDVTLVGPQLIPKPRAWKFQPQGLPAFSAIMKDQRFLAALENNAIQESLRIGIPMTIKLEVKEQKVGNAWVPKRRGRSVIQVIAPTIDPPLPGQPKEH